MGGEVRQKRPEGPANQIKTTRTTTTTVKQPLTPIIYCVAVTGERVAPPLVPPLGPQLVNGHLSS